MTNQRAQHEPEIKAIKLTGKIWVISEQRPFAQKAQIQLDFVIFLDERKIYNSAVRIFFLSRIRRIMNPIACSALFAAFITLASAQNAKPADRNSSNSPVAKPPMCSDSPVTFPEVGLMPKLYVEDVESKTWPVEEEFFLFSSPTRSLAQIKAIQDAMPPGSFTNPTNDWKHLQRTRKILTEGGSLHIMGVGDSIVNDAMRSGWVAKLQEAYPKAKITATVYVRGGGGCQHYKEEGRVKKYILPAKPDLIYIGGISQKDIKSIREVITEIRAGLPDVEFLLTPGVFGIIDPRDKKAIDASYHSGSGTYGKALKKLAEKEKCAYLDLTAPWCEYMISSKLHPHLFYRDVVHANEYGEQVLSKIFMAFWNAK